MDNLKEDRRIRRTKKLLKQGLAEVMDEKPFKDITVKDITDRADLNRGTFYLHYKDTYDLLDKIETEILSDFQSMIDENLKYSDISNSLEPILTPIVNYIADNADFCRLLFKNKASNVFVLKFTQLIYDNGSHILKLINPNLSPEYSEYLFNYMSYGLIGMLMQWFETNMTLPKSELVKMTDKLLISSGKSIFTSEES